MQSFRLLISFTSVCALRTVRFGEDAIDTELIAATVFDQDYTKMGEDDTETTVVHSTGEGEIHSAIDTFKVGSHGGSKTNADEIEAIHASFSMINPTNLTEDQWQKDYSFAVRLEAEGDPGDWKNFCSGSYLGTSHGRSFILTSAHCKSDLVRAVSAYGTVGTAYGWIIKEASLSIENGCWKQLPKMEGDQCIEVTNDGFKIDWLEEVVPLRNRTRTTFQAIVGGHNFTAELKTDFLLHWSAAGTEGNWKGPVPKVNHDIAVLITSSIELADHERRLTPVIVAREDVSPIKRLHEIGFGKLKPEHAVDNIVSDRKLPQLSELLRPTISKTHRYEGVDRYEVLVSAMTDKELPTGGWGLKHEKKQSMSGDSGGPYFERSESGSVKQWGVHFGRTRTAQIFIETDKYAQSFVETASLFGSDVTMVRLVPIQQLMEARNNLSMTTLMEELQIPIQME